MEYLRDRQYYEDLYDRLTLEECRRAEASHIKVYKKTSKKKDVDENELKRVCGVAYHIDILFKAGERAVRREKTIEEWIERDTKREEMYQNAEAPEGINCLTCDSEMYPTLRTLHHLSDETEKVLFMYDCPNKCLPRRSFFEDGSEYKTKKRQCEKCGGGLVSSVKTKGKTITTTETCKDCGNKEIDVYKPTKKKIDKNFEADRKRFCVGETEVDEYLKAKKWLEDVKVFMDDMEERDQNKDKYDAVKNLNKLTVPAMEKLLRETVENEGYSELSFEKPDMGRSVQVEFSCFDAKGREEYTSRTKLKKAISEALESTNWRLMSDGVSCRLGVLTGRVRCYETEEEQLTLV